MINEWGGELQLSLAATGVHVVWNWRRGFGDAAVADDIFKRNPIRWILRNESRLSEPTFASLWLLLGTETSFGNIFFRNLTLKPLFLDYSHPLFGNLLSVV